MYCRWEGSGGDNTFTFSFMIFLHLSLLSLGLFSPHVLPVFFSISTHLLFLSFPVFPPSLSLILAFSIFIPLHHLPFLPSCPVSLCLSYFSPSILYSHFLFSQSSISFNLPLLVLFLCRGLLLSFFRAEGLESILKSFSVLTWTCHRLIGVCACICLGLVHCSVEK